MPHPDLTHVTQGIQARYRGAQPGPRETYHEGEFGTYSRHLDDPSLDSVLIRPLSKDLLPNLWKEVDGYFGEKPGQNLRRRSRVGRRVKSRIGEFRLSPLL